MENNKLDISKLVRENIKALTPYSTARDESDLKCAFYLDANELPFNTGYNRYPDPHQKELKKLFAATIKEGVSEQNIFVGNGSDEAIDLLIRIFCNPRVDNIVTISPTYGMYGVCAAINDIKHREVPLGKSFSLDSEKILSSCDNNSKIIFLCSPNNPTGNLLSKNEIIRILNKFNGIVVIDEAYIDFSGDKGFIPYLKQYSNLVVLRTLSKSKGMAAIRVGFAVTSPQIALFMGMIKYPYNINRVSQELAIKSLKEQNIQPITIIMAERERVISQLKTIPQVLEIYPSDANFLLVKFKDAHKAYSQLLKVGVVTRDRGSLPGCENTLRITIGKPLENSLLLSVLKGNVTHSFSDCIELSRITKETAISLRIYPQGERETSISTGIGFLDHMLEQIKVHGGLSFDLEAKGDINVDLHHTIEDVAIVMGEGLKRLTVQKSAFNRYGFVLPMDESKAEVLIDLGGRALFVWDVEFKSEKIGEFPTEMFKHLFATLSSVGKFTLHITASGENEHHKAEAIFKAFARALKMALANDPAFYFIPSSKGEIDIL